MNEDDDIKQIDNDTNILNKEIIEGLKLLHLKTLYNFTESAYDNIMKIFTTNNTSLYKVKKYLKNVIGLIPVFMICVKILVSVILEFMNYAQIVQFVILLDWMQKEKQKRLCH